MLGPVADPGASTEIFRFVKLKIGISKSPARKTCPNVYLPNILFILEIWLNFRALMVQANVHPQKK